jgi:seryl-tRNA synthetase
MVPTAEPQLVAMHQGETLDAGRPPEAVRRVQAVLPARAHERRTRRAGIERVHWFDKVDMVIHCLLERSADELELMRELELDVLRRLGIAARIVERCTGDLGFNALKG